MHKTIGDCLASRAQQSPHKTALVYGDESYTWAQVDRISGLLSVRLYRQGIRRGTHAGIWSVNTPNWIFTFLALEKLGAIPALINTCYKAEELSRVIQYADLEYVFYGDGYQSFRYEPVVRELGKEPWCQGVRFIPIGRDGSGGWMREGSLLAGESFAAESTAAESTGEQAGPGGAALPQGLQASQELQSQVSPEDTAAMLFTSGTTSVPKGVLLSHHNLVNSALGTLEFTRWTAEDRMLVAVPMFHCFGVTSCLMTAIHAGCTLYLVKYFKSIPVMECIDRYQITVLSGVPSMFLAMVHKPEISGFSLRSLKSGIIAGSAISAGEYRLICSRLPGIALLPSYGQTETSPCVTLMLKEDPAEKRADTAGRLISHVELRFGDPVTGQALPPGSPGEIQVRGYNVMQGYYKLPGVTRETLLPDGWLRTGDLGRMDGDGYLHVEGRIKEMIVRSGENISPREIESCILDLPEVQAVKVIGIPAEVIQEKIIACVVPEPGRQIDEGRILSCVAGRLAHYKVPSRVLEFKEFPVTASGKVLISDLKKQVIGRLAEQRSAEQRSTEQNDGGDGSPREQKGGEA